MTDYYAKKLSAERLQQCYALASRHVRQYLEAEIDFVRGRLESEHTVLELGCGYGRVTLRLAEVAARVVGIDNAAESIEMAKQLAPPESRCEFHTMDALDLSFDDASFDVVVCVQNGICAFGVDQDTLLREAMRVTRVSGRVMLSTYSSKFWPRRLEWFEAQAGAGLLGEIDYGQTHEGTIACKDGFRSGALSPEELASLCDRVGRAAEITEVDASSVFCEITV